MYNESAMIMMLNTLTSTHPGSGTELSFVDLPIQREGHTGFPKIDASTLKGCLRYAVSEKNTKQKEKIDRIFGAPDKGDFASAVSVTDARLFFFLDYKLAVGNDISCIWKPEAGSVSDSGHLVQMINGKEMIMLEDYTYKVKKDEGFSRFMKVIAGFLPGETLTKDLIPERAVLLEDDDFANFVKFSTEVNTRIKINSETGTVDGTALFTEEFLPPECVFYSLVFFVKEHKSQVKDKTSDWTDGEQVRREFLALFPGGTIQIGADSTLGKGLVAVSLRKGENDDGACS